VSGQLRTRQPRPGCHRPGERCSTQHVGAGARSHEGEPHVQGAANDGHSTPAARSAAADVRIQAAGGAAGLGRWARDWTNASQAGARDTHAVRLARGAKPPAWERGRGPVTVRGTHHRAGAPRRCRPPLLLPRGGKAVHRRISESGRGSPRCLRWSGCRGTSSGQQRYGRHWRPGNRLGAGAQQPPRWNRGATCHPRHSRAVSLCLAAVLCQPRPVALQRPQGKRECADTTNARRGLTRSGSAGRRAGQRQAGRVRQTEPARDKISHGVLRR